MNQEQLNEFKKSIYDECIRISNQRGEQYAGQVDAIGNIRRVGKVLDALDTGRLKGSQQYAVTLIVSKLDRIVDQLSREKATIEVVNDSVVDLHNYIDLLYADLMFK